MNNQEIKSQEAKENAVFLSWIKSPAFQLQSSFSKTSDLELYMIAKNHEIADLKEALAAQAKRIAELQISANRYEKLRRLNAYQFQNIFKQNITSCIRFDDLVDNLP